MLILKVYLTPRFHRNIYNNEFTSYWRGAPNSFDNSGTIMEDIITPIEVPAYTKEYVEEARTKLSLLDT